MIEFYECSNYRGVLQVKEDNGRYYWRVDSDMDIEPWQEIPEYLYAALKEYREGKE